MIIKPKAVLFDWDNTIITSKSLLYHALSLTMDQLDMDKNLLTTREFRENIHLSIREAFPKIFGDRWKEVQDIYQKEFRKRHLEHITLEPGVLEILELLNNLGVTMSVVSNKDGPFLRQEVEKLELGKYFYQVIGAYDAKEDKPSPYPAYMALEGLYDKGDFGNDIWFVGDSIADLKCGHNCGCTTIIYGNDQNAIDTAARESIEYLHVNDYSEFAKIVSRAFSLDVKK